MEVYAYVLAVRNEARPFNDVGSAAHMPFFAIL